MCFGGFPQNGVFPPSTMVHVDGSELLSQHNCRRNWQWLGLTDQIGGKFERFFLWYIVLVFEALYCSGLGSRWRRISLSLSSRILVFHSSVVQIHVFHVSEFHTLLSWIGKNAILFLKIWREQVPIIRSIGSLGTVIKLFVGCRLYENQAHAQGPFFFPL
jgi:hypothetical protein